LIAGFGPVCHLMAMHAGHSNLRETFLYFIRLGFLGFGGPLALVASMQRDLIEKRRWMTPEEFVRSFALIKAMPGPVAFQTAVFLGRLRAGWPGAAAAALALNGPSFAMMILFGIFYEQWKDVEISRLFLIGMQASALGVICASLKGMAESYWRRPMFWFLAAVVAVLTAYSPALEPLLILASGFVAVLAAKKFKRITFSIAPLWLAAQVTLPSEAALFSLAAAPQLLLLAWYCFKAGAFVFGSGLAIVPMMVHDFVTHLGWLTREEFMDALAFGQITPGPVVITATFIGYRSFGFIGALVATFAVFLAPFIHMTTWFPRMVNRLARLHWIAPFLVGAIAAVVGAIAATVLQLSLVLEEKGLSVPILIGAFALSVWTRLPVWIVIPASGVLMALLG